MDQATRLLALSKMTELKEAILAGHERSFRSITERLDEIAALIAPEQVPEEPSADV